MNSWLTPLSLSYVPVLMRSGDFATGERGVVTEMGSNSASRSSAENLTAPAASSDRMASASAAFCSCIATIFSSTLPAVISLWTNRRTLACPVRDDVRDR